MKKLAISILLLMCTWVLYACSTSANEEKVSMSSQKEETKSTKTTTVVQEEIALSQDPFLWINERTTAEDIITSLGEPRYSNNGTELEYDNFSFYGEKGTLWFQFNDGFLEEAGFCYEYSNLDTWKSNGPDDKYVPTAEEKHDAQDYAATIKECYLHALGNFTREIDSNVYYGWSWDLSTDFYWTKLELLTSFDSETPVEVYYAAWEK